MTTSTALPTRTDSIPGPTDSTSTVDPSEALALWRENRRLEEELEAKVEELRASRSELAEAGTRARRRIERDLHDGAQQRLVSLALNLALARERLDAHDGEAARQLLDGSREELEQALDELRDLVRGTHPRLLSDRGLRPAIEALARRAPLPVGTRVALERPLPEPVEQAAYFVVSEALTNVGRYASASCAEVTVTEAGGSITVEIADDGVGGAEARRGGGLHGLADRLEPLAGILEVDSPPPGGTTVRARIPRPTSPSGRSPEPVSAGAAVPAAV